MFLIVLIFYVSPPNMDMTTTSTHSGTVTVRLLVSLSSIGVVIRLAPKLLSHPRKFFEVFFVEDNTRLCYENKVSVLSLQSKLKYTRYTLDITDKVYMIFCWVNVEFSSSTIYLNSPVWNGVWKEFITGDKVMDRYSLLCVNVNCEQFRVASDTNSH